MPLKYGVTSGKKIRLKFDISGNVNQEELHAVLDGVESDMEEDIDSLIADSDTEFEVVTKDAQHFLTSDSDSDVDQARGQGIDPVVHDFVELEVKSDEGGPLHLQPESPAITIVNSTPQDSVIAVTARNQSIIKRKMNERQRSKSVSVMEAAECDVSNP